MKVLLRRIWPELVVQTLLLIALVIWAAPWWVILLALTATGIGMDEARRVLERRAAKRRAAP